MAASNDAMLSLLRTVNEEYNFTFKGFLVNHTSQTLSALDELDADKERMLDFVNVYQTDTGYGKLEKYTKEELEEAKNLIITKENLNSHLFTEKASHYYALLKYFKNVVQEEDVFELLFSSFSQLCLSLFTGALHPIIQIGVGVKYNCLHSIAEGLAYAHNTPPLLPPSTCPSSSALDPPPPPLSFSSYTLFSSPPSSSFSSSLSSICQSLRENYCDFSEKLNAKTTSFGVKMRAVANYCGKELEKKVWEWEGWEKGEEEGERKVEYWLRSLCRLSACMYAGGFVGKDVGGRGGCDFFLVHGCTSLWSVGYLIGEWGRGREGEREKEEEEKRKEMCMSYLYALFCVYVCQGVPPLFQLPLPSSSSPSPPSSLSTILPSLEGCCPPSVEEIKETARKSNDEHIPKITAALLKSAEKDPTNEDFYRLAAGFTLANVPTPTSYVF
mmetsp:Transcript_14260/g.22205  ORF Transcript_14260/g.22205 Transcript_14260/m.22205 type:complete len:442 (-) Transcript_14260:224-1549(-)|eukprot:CAMPEP_0201514240 /NCGR_PEP_ID=MMETSP0161_2-20130828/6122_1 /ASSEMBLY_ACC=CAM_ASM_000251 /TAXON_ID=180227 /ORGANISM="Neoparamoeba aestuarina, Strain SoJaBio B1-5/56/2" /LENGTH=441 /DNA_ID=CAMNT_0047910737 /DNA_START=136 /DNA_END=1461 /DNA_ORIENTATION=-